MISKSLWPSFLGSLAAMLVCSAIVTGCSSTPTQSQQLTVAVVTTVAVSATVQRGSDDPAVWAERAARVYNIATELKALKNGDVVTLPALTAALAPLIDKANLAPGERLAANTLIVALSQFIEQNRDRIPESVAIDSVLDGVLNASSVYMTSEAH